MSFGPTEIIILAAIVVLLFGSTAIPRLARAVGTTRREFDAGQRVDAADS